MFSRIRAALAWINNSTVAPAEFELLDQHQADAVDGAGGGAYSPTAPIEILGASKLKAADPVEDDDVVTKLWVETRVDVQIFTSSGTWTKPTAATGSTLVEVELVGGGGGGGGAHYAGIAGGGGGGGSGDRVLYRGFAAGFDATEAIVIGAGGAGGTGGILSSTTAETDGADGGETTMTTAISGMLLRAAGGLGGKRIVTSGNGSGGAGGSGGGSGEGASSPGVGGDARNSIDHGATPGDIGNPGVAGGNGGGLFGGIGGTGVNGGGGGGGGTDFSVGGGVAGGNTASSNGGAGGYGRGAGGGGGAGTASGDGAAGGAGGAGRVVVRTYLIG